MKESYKTYSDSISETGKGRPNHHRFTKLTGYVKIACNCWCFINDVIIIILLLGSRAIIKPKAASNSLLSGKRATKSTSADYDKEIELKRKENAELVVLGTTTQEEAQEADELLGGKEQPAKKEIGFKCKAF